MIFEIPAKTFLLGEYAVLSGGPALLLTTKPCFKIQTTEQRCLAGIHKDSPAGKFWADSNFDEGLTFFDPYNGLGGMGASSAQFVGAYLAKSRRNLSEKSLLETYEQYAWDGEGVKPSGCDVLAQSTSGCVYIHKLKNELVTFQWPFKELSFVLVHTGQKLATHHHLQELALSGDFSDMAQLVDIGRESFEKADAQGLAQAVNAYARALEAHQLVAEHTKELLYEWSQHSEVLAAKGCGAMGADVLLFLVPSRFLPEFCNQLTGQNLQILATSENLFT